MEERKVDARAVLERVLSDPRFARVAERRSGSHPSSRVYGEEPILKTGRQLLEESSKGLPPAYREARAMARSGVSVQVPTAWLFWRQGTLLADVEDDCPYAGTFERYYPTYQSMDDRQLRGYVTWRTRVRRGEVEPTSTSFAFVYVYELLNGIGVGSPEEGFATLRRFWDDYRDLDAAVDRYVRRWLCDYVVYHGLDAGLIADDLLLGGDVAADRALLVLTDPAGRGDAERFAAVADLSGYRVRGSRFYREHPDDVEHVVLAVLGRLEAYYRKNRKRGLYETLFGCMAALPYEPFGSAVFYEAERHPDAVYKLGPLRRYTCRRGSWTCERYSGGRGAGTKLGAVVKAVDARMRQRYGFPAPLKEPATPKYLAAIVEREIDAWLAWKAAHTPRRIEIDRSRLGGIRRAAAETCEELLVDEERGEAAGPAGLGAAACAVPEAPGVAAPAVPEPEASPVRSPAADVVTTTLDGEDSDGPGFQLSETRRSAATPVPPPADPTAPETATASAGSPANPAPFGLTPPELALLERLLDGRPYGDVLAGCPATLDMLVDGINGKLFDLLGDTALEFAGGAPAVIEDYLEDVKGALRP